MATRSVTLAAALAALLAAPLAAQELPDYTPEQRWARAESLTDAWVVAAIRHAKMHGQTVEEFADDMVTIFGPGWSAEMEPLDMLRAMHSNQMWQPGAEFEVLEATPDRVRFRANRAYIPAYFGSDMVSYGVTVDEYEQLLDAFMASICAQRGMTCETVGSGDWRETTIARGAPATEMAAEAPLLPERSDALRWNRAAQFMDINTAVAIGFLKEHGLYDEYVRHMGEVFPPTWGAREAPAQLMAGFYNNMASYPNLEFEVLEVTDDMARFRTNRPWERLYEARSGSLYGATPADVSDGNRRVSEAIAQHLGFTWEQRDDGPWTVVTIRRR